MKTKIYLLGLMVFSAMSFAQTPEILYYNFNGTGTSVPNLASAGTAPTATIVGNLSLGPNTTCLQNGLVGTGSVSTGNYMDTGYNLQLPGSWTIHFVINNFTNTDSVLYYLFGETTTQFRMFTNGVAGANNLMLRALGMTNVTINNVFPATQPVDIILVYDSVAQEVRGYKDGVLETTVAQPSAIALSGGNFVVGGYGTNTGLKTGMVLDEFGLFNRAITAAEVASLSAACSLSTNEVSQSEDKIAVHENSLVIGEGSFGEYVIFDYSGRRLQSGSTKGNTINISLLTKGYYFIKYGEKSARFKK